jgi:hypothetical protein
MVVLWMVRISFEVKSKISELPKKSKMTERERERTKLKNLPDWNLLDSDQKQGFIDQINSSSSQDQFSSILDQADQLIKKVKNWTLLAKKDLTIQEIDQFLLASPVINTSELAVNNSNWKNEIKGAATITLVNQVKDRVVADIRAKRAEKQSENKLSTLIQEAQDLVKQNDLVKFREWLEKISSYRNSSVFQKHKKEVEDLEKHLANADLSKYKEFIINSLQESLKAEPFPVSVEELKENNHDFVTQINQIDDQQALENIKSEVLNNVGEKRAEKLVDNLLIQIEKDFDSEEDRSSVCQEICRLRDNGNQWEKVLWEKNQEAFENFLNWEKKEDTPHQQKENNDQPNYLLPALIVFLLTGAIVAGLVWLNHKLKPFLIGFLIF